MKESIYSSALAQFAGKRVMVIGDLMLDEHVWGTVERISPEAPVMVVQVESDPDCLPGGAANAANNIRALGGEVCMVGIVGDDEGGQVLRQVLINEGIDVAGVFSDDQITTTRKTRVWATHRQGHQVVRIDRESKRGISPGMVDQLVDYITRTSANIDAILISDYAKGVISKETLSAILASAIENNRILVSNLKPRNIACYNGIGIITMNQPEARVASGIDIDELCDVERAGRELLNTTQCQGLVITRGSHGMAVFENDGKVTHIPPIETEVYDATGAGDTTVSALTMSLASGLNLTDAATIANCAGAAVVRKVGVATTTPVEIGILLGKSLDY